VTRVTLVCRTCGETARRDLLDESGSRGTQETCSQPALCPRGHGEMIRQDGNRNVHSKDHLSRHVS
jgi:hypothetical protein